MNWEEIVVLICVWTIVFSGIYINVTRRARPDGKKENSLIWFRVLSPLALAISLVLYYSETGSYSTSTLSLSHFIGALLFLFGMGLRWMAILSLGKSFTVQVSIHQEQKLKTNGIYRYIRHPSYTGLLLYNIGLGFLQHNWICILVLFILPLIAILNRIAYEEKLLNRHFGSDYSHYSHKSKKLIPWLF